MKNKMTKFKLWDRLEIDWIDAVENTNGWRPPEDFNWKDHYAALDHKIIGYYVNECTNAITVCQAYAVNNHNNFVGAFSIPKGSIQKIRRIK